MKTTSNNESKNAKQIDVVTDAVKNANKAERESKAAASVKAMTKYIDRMRDHMAVAHTPSKAVKNAYATAQLGESKIGAKYAKAVAAVFSPKDNEQMKAAVQALCDRYKGRAPKKGFSEYYVHQYFEKLIDQNATTNAACYNYRVAKIVAARTNEQVIAK